MRNRFIPATAFMFAVAVSLFSAMEAQAGVLTLSYSTSDIGGGLYQYDFVLRVTNQDGTYTVGDNYNWIIFGDVPFGNTSPISDFAVISESFSNPDVYFTSSSGGHNGPTWIDAIDINAADAGWVPTGVNDFVTWSGTSSTNVTQGLQWSNLGGSFRHDFLNARYVPEPTSIAIFGSIGLIAFRRRRTA